MKNLLYAIFIGLFVVNCADLDYVDDYSDSTFYDEGAENEYVEVEDDEYAQDVADEEVVEIAKTLNQKDEVAKSATSSDSSESNADDEEIIEEVIEDEIIEEVASGESSDEEIIEAEQTAPSKSQSEPKEVAQPQPTQLPSQPKQISQPTKPAQTTQPTQPTQPASSPRPVAMQSAQSKPKVVYGRGLNGFFQSTAKLKSQCESKGNIRKCEDLARIYALQEKRDLALAYYDKACDSGNGSPLSCFFASRIHENSGDSISAQRYLDALNGAEVKVKNLELNLSTLKVAKAKRSLKMSCTEGNEGACKTLKSIFKKRAEKSEMRTYFGTECWRGSALGCEILRSM